MKEELFQKSAIAIMKLARELMGLKKGDRIPTVSEYVEKLGLSRGTVQNGMVFLKNLQAIELESRGHLGTFLLEIDYKKLWELNGIDLLTGCMPLPYSKLYEGLATGLYKAFEHSNFDFSIAYVRGSRYRMQMLQKGMYSFAITSKLSAAQAIAKGEQIEICFDFGPKTYLSEHVVLFASPEKRSIEDGMKVAVDSNSYDQYSITEQICRGKRIELAEMPYNQIVKAITEHKVDAGVWNLDEIKEKQLGLHYQPIAELTTDATNAVLVISKNNGGIANVLREVLDPLEVVKVQKMVAEDKMIPSY